LYATTLSFAAMVTGRNRGCIEILRNDFGRIHRGCFAIDENDIDLFDHP
jgi:hypothetical protein